MREPSETTLSELWDGFLFKIGDRVRHKSNVRKEDSGVMVIVSRLAEQCMGGSPQLHYFVSQQSMGFDMRAPAVVKHLVCEVELEAYAPK